MIFAVLFLLRRIMHIDWHEAVSNQNISVLVLYVLIFTISVILGFLPWRILVSIFTKCEKLSLKDDIIFCYVFTKANIMKYIPGNVFQYVGRDQIALIYGFEHMDVAMATITEIVLMVAASAVCALSLIGTYAIQYYKDHFLQILLIILAVIFFLGILFFLFYKWKKQEFIKYSQKYKNIILNKKSVYKFILCFFIYMIFFICNGLLFFFILQNRVQTDFAFPDVCAIVGGFNLSWLAGYITPGAPGGIGVREFIMTMLFSNSKIVSADLIVTVSAFYRVINILGDILAYLIMFFISSGYRKEIEPKEKK